MQTEIITIGDELLIGQVINTNAAWMARQLNDAGINVNRVSVISDQKEEIKKVLKESMQRVEIIFLTGGLGPTNDDITKKTLAEFFDSKLVTHQPTLDHLNNFFISRGFKSNQRNKQQADIPDKCVPITNSMGTAPGMWFEEKHKIIISLPGVPIEMKTMIIDHIIPKLKAKYNLPPLVYKTVMIHGIPESILANKLEKWEEEMPDDLHVAYLPKLRIVRLRLSTSGQNKEKSLSIINQQIDKLYPIIGDHIFGFDEDTLESVIGKILIERKQKLSLAESCTGGYISSLITSVAGSSAYYMGGIVSYADHIKIRHLGVKKESLIKFGAVSETVALEMARGAKTKFETDYAISVTGIAGPGGGTLEKPVGTTWIAIATPEKIFAKKFNLGEDRERNIIRATVAGLSMLYDEIKKY